jgi:hypothetical protein
MIHDILQSDLDVATELIKANGTDAEIVEALKVRGVPPLKALQLAQDLRRGRLVTPANPSPPRAAREGSEATGGSERSRSVRRRPGWGRESHHGKSRASHWVIFFLLFCLAAGGGAVVWHIRTQRNLRNAAGVNDSQELPAGKSSLPGRSRPADEPLPSSRAVLELQTDGLHAGDALVTASNALRALSGVFGPPTRTNRLDQMGRVIYAYDHDGILLYAGQGAGGDSVVLDYDGVGGTNGTLLPFAGTIKVGDRAIQAKTRSSDLTTIPQLNLNNPENTSGTFRAHCNHLEVTFAYLNGPTRLSLVEINLKAR